MAGVQRLPDSPERQPARREAATSERLAPRRPTPKRSSSADAFVMEESGATVTGAASGISRRQLKMLRNGGYPIEAKLDLHGRSLDKAMDLLEGFIARARAAGKRCVLIVHGRGLNSGPDGPVLRTATREWLSDGRSRPHVLAFTSAAPAQGGDGAAIVLLRGTSRGRG
jgi:DNA-nicking Smr family endonuclease